VNPKVFVKPDGTTTCCQAFTTFYDGEEYCKGCAETVQGYLDAAVDAAPVFVRIQKRSDR
jgi:hypothetical protein